MKVVKKIFLNFILIGLISISSVSFSVDNKEYNERFKYILEKSQNLNFNSVTKEEQDLIIKKWESFIIDFPTDKSIANNFAVFLMTIGNYTKAQSVIEQALSYDAQTQLLINNLNQIHTFQAQQAYQSVFKKTKVSLPIGEWSAIQSDAKKTIDLARIDNLNSNLQRVLNRTENWRLSWDRQDVERYLSFYKNDYFPKNFTSNKQWRQSRHVRVGNPKFIEVTLTDIQVTPISQNLIEVTFIQKYKSNILTDRSNKKLIWELVENNWYIISERIINK